MLGSKKISEAELYKLAGLCGDLENAADYCERIDIVTQDIYKDLAENAPNMKSMRVRVAMVIDYLFEVQKLIDRLFEAYDSEYREAVKRYTAPEKGVKKCLMQ